MKTLVHAAGSVCCAALLSNAAAEGVTRFDAGTGVVTIPSVSVGGETYVDVRLQHHGGFVFGLAGATPGQAGSPAVGRFDPVSGVLSLPAVVVGAETYIDVTLQHQGNFVFSLSGAVPLPADLRAGIDQYFAADDALFATAVPATGEQRASLLDACWRDDGWDRIELIGRWAAVQRYYAEHQVGKRSTEWQVLGVRSLVNPDGSTRHLVDVSYTEEYLNGLRARGRRTTLIGGSSAGTVACPTAQAEARLRGYGNQQLVATEARARNVREERYAIGTGTPLSPAVRYGRSIQWHIADPGGHATYVIVTGPGPAGTVGGASVPFSLKYLSPRILASAPELQGRNGNFVNMRPDEAFRFCGGASVPVAAVADCVGQGAISNGFGYFPPTPNATADGIFLSAGWQPGSWYRFDVYDDDGWKTVNGHAGRVPVATYWNRLHSLGFSFTEAAGTGPAADAFPRFDFRGLSPAQVRDNLASPSPAPMTVRWTDGTGPFSNLRLQQATETHVGPRTGNAAGVAYPGYRSINESVPLPLGDGSVRWTVTPAVPGQNGKTYADFSLTFTAGKDRGVVSTVVFQ